MDLAPRLQEQGVRPLHDLSNDCAQVSFARICGETLRHSSMRTLVIDRYNRVSPPTTNRFFAGPLRDFGPHKPTLAIDFATDAPRVFA